MKFIHKGIDKGLLVRVSTLALFIALSIAGIVFSAYLFFVANSLAAVALAGAFTVLTAMSSFFNIYASILYYRSYLYGDYFKKMTSKLKPLNKLPTVAIAIPVYNEEPDMVEKSVATIVKMNYPKSKLKIYMLDDSTDAKARNELQRIAADYNIVYIHRDNRKGFKAGALNNMFNYSKEEYIAVFDSDEQLVNRNFLLEILPYFQKGNISYVQTEKRYRKGTLFSDSVDIFDAFFFNFIQPARALNNTAIFAGSCGVISRKALDRIGGFPEYVIEDTFFSFESDMHGYKSLYVPKVYALGKPIKTFTELAKQQWRYNYGDTQFMSYFFNNKGYTKMSPLSKMDYYAHALGLNYLSVVLIFFTLISVGIVFSAVPLAHMGLDQFFAQSQVTMDLELLGFSAFLYLFSVCTLLTRLYFNSWKKGFMVFLLNYSLAIVRARAALAYLINKNPAFQWNRKKFSQGSSKLWYALKRTRTEIAFALFMFLFAFMAWTQSNISGGLWLGWYGVLYSLATVFMRKYG
ncbi:MAG: glycosyltransferase [Candidatus Marsarchaeota archaeon]|nr:glycosyltransferase [Candidatus Marsarchaeota archaeon]